MSSRHLEVLQYLSSQPQSQKPTILKFMFLKPQTMLLRQILCSMTYRELALLTACKLTQSRNVAGMRAMQKMRVAMTTATSILSLKTKQPDKMKLTRRPATTSIEESSPNFVNLDFLLSPTSKDLKMKDLRPKIKAILRDWTISEHRQNSQHRLRVQKIACLI